MTALETEPSRAARRKMWVVSVVVVLALVGGVAFVGYRAYNWMRCAMAEHLVCDVTAGETWDDR